MKNFMLDIKGVSMAHEYELNEQNKCDYSSGRGAYGLVFGISGYVAYKFNNGTTLSVGEGDALIIGKNAAYRINIPVPFKHYTVNFDIHEESSTLPIEKNGFYKITVKNKDDYKHAFKELTKSRELLAEELCDMSVIGKLYGIFGMIAKDEEEKTNESYEYRRLLPAKQFIENNLDSLFTLDTLAKLSNMSTTNFRREWKRIYKITPLEYRDSLKIKKAKDILHTSFDAISEIAEKCGFTDTSYFIRFFKKHTGFTPTEYRSSSAIL